MSQPSPMQLLPVAAIAASATNPRKRFDETALAELTESVRTHGVLQPVLVRPNGAEGAYELIAGERRLRAARAAGLEHIPALVRELSDGEVLEVQVIENLQRADLHPLEEAEGYEALLHRHGYNADTLAAKVGKSRSYIYARLKLCALGKKAREAFYAGKLEASVALLLARIPVPARQDEALKEILQGGWQGPMSYRMAAEHVQHRYMLRLAEAPFPRGDADLVPGTGRCHECPKRTGSQPELFPDVTSADVCTDPDCYAAKRAAHTARLKAQAEASGRSVITGKAAQKLKPHSYGGLAAGCGYVQLDDHCYEDDKSRTYRQILGKKAPAPALLEDPHGGALIEIAAIEDLKPLLKEKGIKARPVERDDYTAAQRARVKKAQAETTARAEILAAVLAAHPGSLARADLELVAGAMWDRLMYDLQKRVAKSRSWDVERRDAGAQITALPDPDLVRFLVEMALAGDVPVNTYSSGKSERLDATATRLGVDTAEIRAIMKAAEKAKAKPNGKSAKPEAKKPAKKKPRVRTAAPPEADQAPVEPWPFPIKG